MDILETFKHLTNYNYYLWPIMTRRIIDKLNRLALCRFQFADERVVKIIITFCEQYENGVFGILFVKAPFFLWLLN
jgi:hypothetical protein